LLAKKTPFMKLNLNNSLAKGELSALSFVGKSTLPFTNSLFTKNFMLAGLGVASVNTLIVLIYKLCTPKIGFLKMASTPYSSYDTEVTA
jgi:hypothetical protein